MNYFEKLHKAFEQIGTAKNLDGVIKQSVVALHTTLGFDRAGILLYDADHQEQVATWGVDAKGRLRNEHGLRFPVTDDLIMTHDQPRILVRENWQLKELGEVKGSGWHLQAAIFSEKELYGWLFIDNLIHGRALSDEQLDVIRIFATVLGQLIVRSKIEDVMLDALDSLASNESNTAMALHKVQQLETQLAGNKRMVQLAEKVAGLIPMSSRFLGNLLNFVALLTPEKFDKTDQALLASAKKSAERITKIFRYVDEQVHEATDNDAQRLPTQTVVDYWHNQFQPMFRSTPFQLFIQVSAPNNEVTLPLVLMTQLLKELLHNAIAHGLEQHSEGTVYIKVDEQADLIRVTVEDSGDGLDEEQLHEITTLFATSKPNEYLGTGLNVVQHYVERWLNGQLVLSPSEKGGLCCTLILPTPTMTN